MGGKIFDFHWIVDFKNLEAVIHFLGCFSWYYSIAMFLAFLIAQVHEY
jgi:hypothetical protein